VEVWSTQMDFFGKIHLSPDGGMLHLIFLRAFEIDSINSLSSWTCGTGQVFLVYCLLLPIHHPKRLNLLT